MLERFLKNLWASRPAPAQSAAGEPALNEWLVQGIAAQRAGRLPDAENWYRRILERDERHPDALYHLGTLAETAGHPAAACELYRHASSARRDWFDPWFRLGNALRSLGRIKPAIEAMETAARLDPGSRGARMNLAMLLWEGGRGREAESLLREMAAGTGDAALDAHQNLLLMLNYREDLEPGRCYDEHLVWAARYADPVSAAAAPPERPADPGRPLNIGYVSPDFRLHPVALFLLPLLNHHDRARHRIHLYATRAGADDTTARLRSAADEWRDIAALSDDEAADMIRRDGIDVLVDLAGHTGWNRLLLFARRPAPVQLSWLGYLNTTGMRAMDARLTDVIATPEAFDALHTERIVRLPGCQWCFQPLVDAPDVSPSPPSRGGTVTFGSFHNLVKVGPAVIALWSRLLRQLPRSRLLLMAKGLADGRQDLLERFGAEGVAADRIELRNAVPYRQYLATYGEVDIALDAFPYSGGTTTCESLWMGVPVVTWAFPAVAGRGAASILSAAGLPELVAESPEQYLSIAADLAASPPRLEALRASLRGRMRQSPLMDAPRFAAGIEDAYRALWGAWCAKRSPTPASG